MSLLNNNNQKGKKGNKNQKNNTSGSKFITKPTSTKNTNFAQKPHKAGGTRGS